jgi:hypothetical protein
MPVYTAILLLRSSWPLLKRVYEVASTSAFLVHGTPHYDISKDCYTVYLKPFGYLNIPTDEEELRRAIRCILLALLTLHGASIVHRLVGCVSVAAANTGTCNLFVTAGTRAALHMQRHSLAQRVLFW